MGVCGIYLIAWSATFASRPYTMMELRSIVDLLDAWRETGASGGPRLVFVRLDRHPIPMVIGELLWIDAASRQKASAIDRIVDACFSPGPFTMRT